MKSTAYLIFILTIISAISSALLAAVYNITQAPIAASLEQRTVRAAAAVLPQGVGEPQKRVVAGETYFVVKAGEKVAAVALEGRSANGYGGEIVLMVGLQADGKVVNFQKLVANETPGLGTKINEEPFMAQLRGRSFNFNWRVKKDGGAVEAVTAATISSRAALECIRDAIEKYERVATQL